MKTAITIRYTRTNNERIDAGATSLKSDVSFRLLVNGDVENSNYIRLLTFGLLGFKNVCVTVCV